MLLAGRIAQALEERREAFHASALSSEEDRARYREAFQALRGMSVADVQSRLGGVEWPGARPVEGYEREGAIIPFTERWTTVQEARTWALGRLRGVPTLAVDGSQIAASKEFGVPVSLVQVAWFENYHDPGRPYIKDIRDEVVTVADDEESGDYQFAESRLNQRRFVLEMETAAERMREMPRHGPPVVFVDGTLVLSFVRRMVPEIRDVYLRALFDLLDVSRACRVPVVGYVDFSLASDLATMLGTAWDLPAGAVDDGQILQPLMRPLDRTSVFLAARQDVSPLYRTAERDRSGEICFLYLETGADRPPARVDMPRWVVDDGLVDWVVDVIRAEVVVGSGYPYALETADAAAVLTLEDRMAFYRIFHEFARSAGLSTVRPGKTISKVHRR